MRGRPARKDAGRRQQMPMLVPKCANAHKHIFQKAYFRKWRLEKQFCAKLNGPQLAGMKLNARGSKRSLAAFVTAKCCKHSFYYTHIASKCQRPSPKTNKKKKQHLFAEIKLNPAANNRSLSTRFKRKETRPKVTHRNLSRSLRWDPDEQQLYSSIHSSLFAYRATAHAGLA